MGYRSNSSICAGRMRQCFRPAALARGTDTDGNQRSRAVFYAHWHPRARDPGDLARSAEERGGCGA